MSKLEWLKERQCGIGGSDVGAIFGVNKWKTPFQVYLDKTEDIVEVSEQSESAYWGDQFEDVVAKEFEKRTGKKVRRDTRHFKHKEFPFMVANIDRRVVGENAILECKTANQYLAKEWEDEEIPASYLLQVQHYLAVTGMKKGYIAVLVGGQKFIWKEIERDEELIELIISEEKEFWKRVQDKNPPALDGSSAAEKYLNERYKNVDTELSVKFTSDFDVEFEKLNELKENEKEIKEQIKEIENKTKDALGEAECGSSNSYVASWKQVISNRVDSKKLKVEFPDVYEKCCKESKSRRFSIKELK
ncbi:MAG: YqaJ viral recombinase family protein [Clostridium sp.]